VMRDTMPVYMNLALSSDEGAIVNARQSGFEQMKDARFARVSMTWVGKSSRSTFKVFLAGISQSFVEREYE
jgi:hypothetical protein